MIKNIFVAVRNTSIHFLYTHILKKIFFLRDPEDVHDRMVKAGVALGKFRLSRFITRVLFGYSHPMLEQTVVGITFKNPVGLSAGFDKNAQLLEIMPYVGFGFEEVGSITGEYCEGNPKPRLWRLPKSQSLGVYYGLKNDGAEAISQRLAGKTFEFPVGISIAKTNSQETCDTEVGVADYLKAYKAFATIGDYYTINISCPNTFGGQPFTDKAKLTALLEAISSVPKTKPIFIKLSPDLSQQEVDTILSVSANYAIDGFVISNLTKKRDNPAIKDSIVPEKGGFSGKVIEPMANDLIKYIYKKTNGKYCIIGCGGIFNGEDAYKKIKAGASLLQMITGMIYEGPQTISTINKELVALLKKDGYTSIEQAVGVDVV